MNTPDLFAAPEGGVEAIADGAVLLRGAFHQFGCPLQC